MRRQSMRFRLFLVAMLMVVGGPAAFAQEFALQIGPPVAAMPQPIQRSNATSSQPGAVVEKKVNDVAFVVRPVHCADPGSARITATAEGYVDGARRSVPLTLRALPAPGVHAVSGRLPTVPGVEALLGRSSTVSGWVVRLTGECAGAVAGALVTLDPFNAYRRDAVQLIAGAPTPAQIDSALLAAKDARLTIEMK